MAPRQFKFPSRRPFARKSSSSSAASRKMAPNPILTRKSSPKAEKPMKGIFKGKHMSLAGNFLSCGKPATTEQIAAWITSHGGKFDREVNDSTTHLICAIEEYKKKSEHVQAAWKLGKKQCQIVVFDWLVDCLLGTEENKWTKRSLPVQGYTLDRTLARIKKGKTDHAVYRKRFEEGVKACKELCDNRLHHVYYDPFDNFEYKIILTRINIGGRIKVEKYTAYLFESHAKPPTWMFGAKLSRSHRPSALYRNFMKPMDFSEAFARFKKFFHEKTGINWDDRLEGIKMPEDYFVYTPPILGRPVGFVQGGYVRPELREEERETESEESGEGEEGDVAYDTDSEVDDSESEEDTVPSGTTNSRAPSEEFSFTSINGGGSGSVESDGLGSAFEMVMETQTQKTPPEVIYLSD